ncbi:Fc.00g049750.m01.CDS01 [Cosmosporella sp. VM-42]
MAEKKLRPLFLPRYSPDLPWGNKSGADIPSSHNIICNMDSPSSELTDSLSSGSGHPHVSVAEVLSRLDFSCSAPARTEASSLLHLHEWLRPEFIGNRPLDAGNQAPGNNKDRQLNDESLEPKYISLEANATPSAKMEEPPELVDSSFTAMDISIELKHASEELEHISDEPKGKRKRLEPSKPLEENGRKTKPKESKSFNPSRTWNLPLTTIEQNAPRQRRRIAMLMRYTTAEPGPTAMFLQKLHLQETQTAVKKAFFRTLEHWPFLRGTFRQREKEPNLLILQYPERLRPWEQEALFLGIQNLGAADHEDNLMVSGCSRELKSLLDIPLHKTKRFPFLEQKDDKPFSPISLGLDIIQDVLVLAFEFSEVIFDLGFIENFLNRFFMHTRNSLDHNPILTHRQVPIGSTDELVDWESFKFYDWSGGSAEAFEALNPPQDLAAIRINISPVKAIDIYEDCVNVLKFAKSEEGFVCVPDCMLAALWVHIMRARVYNRGVRPTVVAMMRIAVTGAVVNNRPRRLTDQHFGNSTVQTVATLETDFDEFNEETGIGDYATAAQAIRRAIDKVTPKYIQDLMTDKRNTPGLQDRAAHRSQLNAERLTFEDWTSLGADSNPDIPHVKDNRPYFLPCGDNMREGQIIFLPRKGGYWSQEEPWGVAICLSKVDMEKALANLRDARFI